jgi:16S rRNA (adenine1518-N6/adenine1519-N6)-dimethyltransferase
MMRARKRFGQHFLEPAWVDKVIRAIDPKPDDVFLEIGPGHGALTRPLAAAAKAVIAYEIDRDLAAELRPTAPANVRIVEGDFLNETIDAVGDGAPPFRVAGNLPYNVAAPILFTLVDYAERGPAPALSITDATLMVQREVADRLVANPGTRDYGVLTVLIRHSASVARLMNLPPGAFRPAPKVHSSLVRLRFHAPEPPVSDRDLFRGVVQAVFTQRRKKLANALLAYPAFDAEGPSPERILSAAGIDAGRRPETLTLPEFAQLVEALRNA